MTFDDWFKSKPDLWAYRNILETAWSAARYALLADLRAPNPDFEQIWARYSNEFDWDDDERIKTMALEVWKAGRDRLTLTEDDIQAEADKLWPGNVDPNYQAFCVGARWGGRFRK